MKDFECRRACRGPAAGLPRACPVPQGRVASADSFIRPSACSLGRAASADSVIRPSACPLGRAASAKSCTGPSGLVHVFGDRHQPDPCFRPFTCLQDSPPSASLLQTHCRLPNLKNLVKPCKNAIPRSFVHSNVRHDRMHLSNVH